MSTENQPITVLSVYTTYAWVQPVGSSSGITLPIADGRYLKKLIPDTATALETFSGGILTSSVDSLGSAIDLNIGNNLVDFGDNLYFASNKVGGSVDMFISAGGSATFDVYGAGIRCSKLNPRSTASNLLIGNDFTNQATNIQIAPNKTIGTVNVFESVVSTATFKVSGAGILTNNLNSLGSAIDLNIGSNLVDFGDNLYLASNKVGGSVDMFISAGGSATLDIYGNGIRCSKLNPRSTASNFLIGNDYTNQATNIEIAPNKTTGTVSVLAAGTGTLNVSGDGIKSNKIRQTLTTDTLTIGNGGPITINAKNTTSGICPVVGDQVSYTYTVTIRTVPDITAYCPTGKLEVGGIYGLRLRMFTTNFGATYYLVALTSRGTPITNGLTGLTPKYDGALAIENDVYVTQNRWSINLYAVIKVVSNEEYLGIISSISSTSGGSMNYDLQVTRLA